MKWSAWKSVLAGAVIGFTEAAGPESARRALHSPPGVVRTVRRRPRDPLAELGVWFLDPVRDPRPLVSDERRVSVAEVVRVAPLRILRLLGVRGSLTDF